MFGLSTQDNVYQTEMASRLHLPFPVLSDEKLALTRALKLPTMQVAGLTLIKRLALIVDDGRITHVFYPVFPPDRNAGDVLAWLKENPAKCVQASVPTIRGANGGHAALCPPYEPESRSVAHLSQTRCETSPASAPAYWCCSASSDSCRRA